MEARRLRPAAFFSGVCFEREADYAKKIAMEPISKVGYF
jgi:hypothetical protein